MADIYTVGVQIDTSQLERGTQTARQALQGLGAAESQLERQTKSVDTASKAFASTETTLTRAIAATEQQARQAGGSLEQLGRQTQQATTAKKAFTGGLQAMLGPFGSVQGAAVVLGGYLTGQFVRSAAGAAAELLTLRQRLDAATGSATTGARDWTRLFETAQRLGAEVTTLAANYASFAGAVRGTALEGDRGFKVFEQLAAATTRMGLSSEQTNRALQALQQALSKGTLSAEELRGQMAEALPGAVQITARALGVTTERLNEMLEQGLIPATMWAERFASQLEKETGPAVERFGSGTARLGNTLKELAGISLGPVLRELDQAAGAVARLVQNLGNLSGAWVQEFEAAAKRAGVAIQDLGRTTAEERQRMLEGPPGSRMPWELPGQGTDAERQAQRLRAAALGQQSAAGDIAGGGPVVADPAIAKTRELTQATDAYAEAQRTQARVAEMLAIPAMERLRQEQSLLSKQYQENVERLQQQPSLERTDPGFVALVRQQQARLQGIEAEITRRREAASETKRLATEAERDEKRRMREADQERERIQKAQQQFQAQLVAARDRATQSEEGLVRLEALKLGYTKERATELATFAAETAQMARETTARDQLDAMKQDLLAINVARQEGIELSHAQQLVELDSLDISQQLKDSLVATTEERRTQLDLLRQEDQARAEQQRAVREREQRQERTLEGAMQDFYAQLLGPEQFDRWVIATSDMDEATKRLTLSVMDSTDALRQQQEAAAASAEKLRAVGETLTTSVLSAIEEVTQTGEFSFKKFADSVISDLLRVLQQEYLKPAMEGWVQAGLKLAAGVLGGLGGGTSAGIGAALSATEALSTVAGGAVAPSQTGGPLRRGLTLVGEAGPEVIAIRAGGRAMVFPTSHPLTRAAVRDRLPGRQFGGPLPSAVMGSTGSDAAPATMTSGPGANGPGTQGNVYITVYAQDAASFQRSRGEIQRSMRAAFAASQRS